MESIRESIKKFFSSKNSFKNFFAFYIYTTGLAVAVYIVKSRIPVENQRLADILLGTVIVTSIVGIISYEFGSSASSREKDNTIQELTKKDEQPK